MNSQSQQMWPETADSRESERRGSSSPQVTNETRNNKRPAYSSREDFLRSSDSEEERAPAKKKRLTAVSDKEVVAKDNERERARLESTLASIEHSRNTHPTAEFFARREAYEQVR